MRRALISICAAILAGCTPGAQVLPSGAAAAPAHTLTIDVNLTLHGAVALAQGSGAGYAPAALTVPLGSSIRFINSDGFPHTATALSGTTFANVSPPGSAALTQAGSMLSVAWSSGTLNAGAASQSITVDRAGTYIYGCFFHPVMRGVIVAQ